MGGPNALTENDFAPSSQVQIESAVELAASDLEKGHGDAFHADGASVNGANTNGADAKANGFSEEVKETGKGKGEAEEAKKAEKTLAVPYYKLFKYADNLDVLLVIGGTVAAIVEGAALPVFFVFFGKLINSLGTYFDQPIILADRVNKYSLYFVYTGLVVLVSAYFDVSLWMWTGERQSSRIRTKYLRAILRQDVGYFDVGTSTGEVVSRVNDDTLLMQDAVGEKVGNFLKNMATFVAGFVVGFSQVWQLTLVLFAIIPLLATPGMLYARTLKGLSSQGAEAYSDAGRIVEESLSSVRTVYSFAAEEKTEKAYEAALDKTYKLGLKASLAKGMALGAQGILFFAWALMFWYGSVLVRHGDANGGKILSTAFAVIIGGLSLGQAVPNLKNFAEGCTAAYKVFQMIDRVPAIDSEDLSGQKLENVEGNIELRNVSFRYPARPDVSIFQNFSLTIPDGRQVALVGSSGSGKSTVIQLLERFYDPAGGEIFLDGHNIRTLQLKWLRQQYGLVSQEPALFATSIKENILYGKDGATQEEIEAAAKAANAHNFIVGLPQGYDTQVGDRGVQLSGGQKQRVAIARAILKQPKILLLDEATSALDSESEHVVQAALDNLMVGRTTVVIAHRLSTIRNADVIAVVQKGEIVEQGSHDDLIGRGGAYASLVKLQEIREDHSDEEERPDDTLSLDSPGKSFKKQSSGLSAQRSGLSQQRSGLGQQRSGLGMQKSGLSDKEGGNADSKVAEKPPRPSFWRLLALNKPEWPYLLLGTIGAIAAGLVNPFWALIVSQVTSIYYYTDLDKMKHDVRTYCFIFLGLGGAALLAYTVEHFCYGAVGEALTKRVRQLMLKKLLRQEVGFFDKDENSPGALAARVGTDATYVRAVVGDRMYLIVQALTGVLASFIIGLVLEWRLALVMVATFPLLTVGAIYENIVLRGFSDETAKAQESASQVAAGAVGNVRTVAAFSAEDKVLALFNQKLEVPRKLSFRRGQTSGFGLGLSQFFLYASWALALWYGTELIKKEGASFDDVLKVFLVIVSVGFGVAEAASLAPDVAKGGTATESVFEVVDRRTEIDSDAHPENKLEKLEGAIELRNVSFSYPTRPEVPIFKNFSLKVKPGLTVALVGQSGSGKSTIISLIERFYAPTEGRILIDGKDIATLHLKTLRSQIGLVSQEPTLFSGTIKSNILYGKANASEAEIVEAARAANAHNFISALPAGYETPVGEKGVQLSGGQKQRIAIARAAIKSPRILLLDEATSALDTESERVVQDALDRLMVGRTTLVIAHRLSTVRHADVIAVVQEGAIVEQGSHDQLIAKGEGGAYYSLVNIQNKGPI